VRWPQLTIAKQLTVLMMTASLAAVLFACTAFAVVTLIITRGDLVENLCTLADITARNCEAAVAFDLPHDAERVLGTLEAKPSVVLACVYGRDGEVLAVYRRNPDVPVPLRDPPGHVMSDGYMRVFRDIMIDGERLGTVLIQDDMRRVDTTLVRMVGILGTVLLAAAMVSGLLAVRMQRRISGPIIRLTEGARQVAQDEDYSFRVKHTREDETGTLAEAFNQMLGRIQERDAELRKANAALEAEIAERRRAEQGLTALNATLEQRVGERTQQLTKSNEELERFAYIASHDLQEPLRTVTSFARLLSQRYQGQLDDKANEFIDLVVDGANRAQTLINDLF
jgi:HAMP domain-containing protein